VSGAPDKSGHTHSHGRKAAGGPDDGAGPDWYRVMDVLVWVGVAAVAVIGIEWLFGKMVRESIASGASRYLKKHADANTPE
jgi:hypothetical protein